MSRTPGGQATAGLEVLYLDESAKGLKRQAIQFSLLTAQGVQILPTWATSGLQYAQQVTTQTQVTENQLEDVDYQAFLQTLQVPVDAAETRRAVNDPLTGNFPGIDQRLGEAQGGISGGVGSTVTAPPAGSGGGPPPDQQTDVAFD